ncbi:hypothetical protein LVD15_20785 [Fulvivirga maritima]|uniref:hypothetical protein n=1 Tax=Fulvivirga maritima TaxID=2904247 RepID=UPI001F20281C|nr:hypothetical protein [Fulvivirga maritima]UII25719.1 hypothetical protein LVD15_20785 [Fulvivirga maritima]
MSLNLLHRTPGVGEAYKLDRGYVCAIKHFEKHSKIFCEKGFYKICLVANGHSSVGAEALLFYGNPKASCSCETMPAPGLGYTFLFSEDFVLSSPAGKQVLQSPLFNSLSNIFLKVSPKHASFLCNVFKQMMNEQDSHYLFKGELMLNYLNILVFEGMKISYKQGE